MAADGIIFDGLFKSAIREEQDHSVHEWSQPSEDLIAHHVQRRRLEPEAVRDLTDEETGETWGRQVASIPFVVWYKAIKDGFQLNHRDTKFANEELWRFMRSEEGQKWIVREVPRVKKESKSSEALYSAESNVWLPRGSASSTEQKTETAGNAG
jgi:hypothetical protein